MAAVPASPTKRWRRVAVWAALYAITWVGGWISHAHELAGDAQRRWDNANRYNQEVARREAAGEPHRWPRSEINPGGPSSRVLCCVPVLPGVLLAWSGSGIGPLNGEGGLKVVLFFGFGSIALPTPLGWIS